MPRRRPSSTDTLTLPGLAADDGADAAAAPRPPVPLAPAPPAPAPFRVEVVRSRRRKRTVGAQLAGGVLTVTVPAWMSATDADGWATTMTARFARQLTADRIDLDKRAATLARRHRLPRPRSIRWADDMRSRWASCTPATATVRVSNRIARFPDWVVDYVLVHELAHLEVPDHSPAFWALVNRYPRAERARGYLIAKSTEGDEDDDCAGGPQPR